MNPEPGSEQRERESARRILRAIANQREDLRHRLSLLEGGDGMEAEEEFCQAVLLEVDREVEAFHEAAKLGAGWQAACHAWQIGRWTVFYDVWALPDAVRGRGSVTHGAKGGLAKTGKHRHPPEKIRAAVLDHPRFEEPAQWSNVTEWVGQKVLNPRMSGKQVRRILERYFPDVKW